MSQTRHFHNSFLDYQAGQPVALERNHVREQVLLTAHLVLKKGKSDNYDGSIYVGPTGITYMFLHLLRHSDFLTSDERTQLMRMAKEALDNHIKYFGTLKKHDRNDPAAFLLGKGGVNAVAAVFAKLTGNEHLYINSLQEFTTAANVCKPHAFRHGGSDELFVGRAGYLCGALWLQQNLGGQLIQTEDLRSLWRGIVESGRAYAFRKRSPCPLMYAYYETEYLGAAHGLCSILQILLSFPQFCREFPQDELVIRQSIDYYLSIQNRSGNFPCSLDEVINGAERRIEADLLVHWCHGAPGAIYMLAKAYLHFNDGRYLNACISCGDLVWEKGLLMKGPGICHGVAGNGYVFLLLHRLTEGKDPKHFYRATKFSEFLNTTTFKTQARTPDCPYSLYEGLAGTVCFMADLLYPDEAVFPFFDIYYNYQ